MSNPHDPTAATWSWPRSNTEGPPAAEPAKRRQHVPGDFDGDGLATGNDSSAGQPRSSTPPSSSRGPPPPRPSRRQPTYGPRTCRICLDVVQPRFEAAAEHVPGFLASGRPRVVYESDDPALGRLLRPCKCKGSSRYVHEGCLELWRKADPAMGRRNYWQCPTCGFAYRLRRVSWGRWLNSTLAQLGLTATIFITAIFALGFIADPIINLYLDPLDTVLYGVEKIAVAPDDDGRTSWPEHFAKGLASLGLLGFVKALLAMSPWQWWNIRSSGLMSSSGGRATSGRDRVASISWVVIIMGVGTFLWAVFKGVRAWSRRTLEIAAEKVMDVPLDDEDEANEEPEPATAAAQ